MFRAVSSFIGLMVIAGISTGDASAQQLTGRVRAIAASKTVKIAFRSDASPFSFVNDRSEVAGYTIDLCKMIVVSLHQQLGLQSIKIQWVPVTAQSRFDAVATGKADLECGSSSVTLARMKQVDFSSYIFTESTGLVVNASSSINTLLDLAGKKIAVVTGTSNEKALVTLNQQALLNMTLVPVRGRDAGVIAVRSGSADAFASDKLLLVGAQFASPDTLRMLPDNLSTEFYAIVLPRGDWALRLAVNTALSQIFRNGQGIKVFEQWFPQIGLRPGLMLDALFVLGSVPD